MFIVCHFKILNELLLTLLYYPPYTENMSIRADAGTSLCLSISLCIITISLLKFRHSLDATTLPSEVTFMTPFLSQISPQSIPQIKLDQSRQQYLK